MRTKHGPDGFCALEEAKARANLAVGKPVGDGTGRAGTLSAALWLTNILTRLLIFTAAVRTLIFPHHENEIAQSEAANCCQFANYWVHNGYINVDNRKMSKSLGNFFTVRDVAKEFDYEVIRFFMLSAHYRSPINFSKDLMESASSALERIRTCMDTLKFLKESASGEDARPEEIPVLEAVNGYKQKFIDAMDDDLNTADAISAIF